MSAAGVLQAAAAPRRQATSPHHGQAAARLVEVHDAEVLRRPPERRGAELVSDAEDVRRALGGHHPLVGDERLAAGRGAVPGVVARGLEDGDARGAAERDVAGVGPEEACGDRLGAEVRGDGLADNEERSAAAAGGSERSLEIHQVEGTRAGGGVESRRPPARQRLGAGVAHATLEASVEVVRPAEDKRAGSRRAEQTAAASPWGQE